MFARALAAFAFLYTAAAFAQQAPSATASVSAETCGKLFGTKQTAERLRNGGFSQKQTLDETLNRPEWREASMHDVVWAVRIIDEVYKQPGIETSQVVRECRARIQGLDTPEPIQLPEDFSR